MGQDDWFRNKTWDKEASELFETKLKRSRGAYHKAQYLRIQASYLLSSTIKEFQIIGIELMERMLKDFPTEDSSTIFGKEQLGDYFFRNGDFEKAERHYKQVTEYYGLKGRSGTSGMADVKLAETILELNQRDKFEYAYTLLTTDFEKTRGSLSLNDDIFFYSRVIAEICDRLGKTSEAKLFADKALEISKITAPQFSRHKTVGLVRTTQDMLDTLTKIKAG
jgi:tetratricopeptide (TPR) repeat protein